MTLEERFHTIAWDKVCRLKCERGLRIRRTEDLMLPFWQNGDENTTQMNNIWVKLMEGKYLRNNSYFFYITKTRANSTDQKDNLDHRNFLTKVYLDSWEWTKHQSLVRSLNGRFPLISHAKPNIENLIVRDTKVSDFLMYSEQCNINSLVNILSKEIL